MHDGAFVKSLWHLVCTLLGQYASIIGPCMLELWSSGDHQLAATATVHTTV